MCSVLSDGLKFLKFPADIRVTSAVPLFSCFGILLSQRQKILQQQPARFRQHAFRMELHTFDREAADGAGP